MHYSITIALIVTNFHAIQDTYFLALYRVSHILLYANYIIKWCCTYPGNRYVFFFRQLLFSFSVFISIPISLYSLFLALAMQLVFI